MTREQTIEAIKVMQGFVDGKEVQYRIKKYDSRSVLKPDWCDTDAPWWDFDGYEYRIKPTQCSKRGRRNREPRTD